MTLIPVFYLLMGCMITCYLMSQPGINMLSDIDKKRLLATTFLAWPLIIIELFLSKD